MSREYQEGVRHLCRNSSALSVVVVAAAAAGAVVVVVAAAAVVVVVVVEAVGAGTAFVSQTEHYRYFLTPVSRTERSDLREITH